MLSATTSEIDKTHKSFYVARPSCCPSRMEGKKDTKKKSSLGVRFSNVLGGFIKVSFSEAGGLHQTDVNDLLTEGAVLPMGITAILEEKLEIFHQIRRSRIPSVGAKSLVSLFPRLVLLLPD